MSLINFLSTLTSTEYLPQTNLTRLTTIKLSAVGDLVFVKSEEDLKKLVTYLYQNQIKYRVVGWGANQVFPPVSKDLYLKIELPWDSQQLDSVKSIYHLSASTPLNVLTAHAIKFGLVGWEVFTGVPASLGGAIAMNAGTNLGEIGSLIKEVKVIKRTGEVQDLKLNADSFKYRGNLFLDEGDIIISATMVHFGQNSEISDKIKKYLDLRTKTQPLSSKTCGCVFKNYSNILKAGQMIDLLGLKGLVLNGLKVSHKHANFIENMSDANSDDFFKLTEIIKSELEYNFGVKFEFEVKID